MNGSATTQIEKNVVLLGAGNAHLRFVKMHAMRPQPGIAVTLVSEASIIPYSAMVPGCIAGDYPLEAITIDLVRLCRAANVRFIADRAIGIDTLARRVTFANRPEVRYDALCLGLGSLPIRPPELIDAPWSWSMRPLHILLQRIADLDADLRKNPRSLNFVVVGGGASGCELALAISKRFRDHKELHVTLLHAGKRLLPQFPDKADRLFRDLLSSRNITLKLDTRVCSGDANSLKLADGTRLECDIVLWATNAAPPMVLADSGLTCDANGFVLVTDSLKSVSHRDVFGTGDCVSLCDHPALLKNGVYAVRQGGVLFDNVMRFLHDKPLEPFQPQKRCLCLMNAADDSAVLCYGPLVWKSRFARWWKDRIDRQWIDQFSQISAMSTMPITAEESPSMRCGGCGSKISSDVLSAVLRRIDVGSDPRMLLGAHAGEDASVHRMRPELFGSDPAKLVEVQTVDYFKAFVDDPYLFGRIAALNSVSDLYAMNARPFSALAIATLPYARGPVQEGMLFELMSGAVDSLKQLGVILAGGHTTEGAEMALGFAVTGYAEEDRLFQKSSLEAGDRLILTKPIGSGALLAAWMRGACKAEWYEKLMRHMLQANDRAGAIFANLGVRACTDVTGFGLAGHLMEMLDASGVSARLYENAMPIYDGFAEVVAAGIVSTLHKDNAKVACRVFWCTYPPIPRIPGRDIACQSYTARQNNEDGEVAYPAWLFDPQTSGGMLGAVKAQQVNETLRLLKEAGYANATMIGEVVAVGDENSPTIFV